MTSRHRDAGSGLRSLTLGEARVARLVAAGFADEEIAERLAIAVVDVSAELADIVRKLGLRSRTELALFAPGERQPAKRRASRADPG